MLKENDDIIQLITNDKWEDVLVNLTKDMDPWNIDLLSLNQRFTYYIREMKKMDLRIPAKILLTAAIIYRLKSETLKYVEEDVAEELIEEPNGKDHEVIVIPQIQIPIRRQPKRKVNVMELINALNGAMKIQDRREVKQVFKLDLKGEDITKQIEELYGRINTLLKKTEAITFSGLLKPKTTIEDKLMNFNSILHLSNQERILCEQERLFEEIFIKRL